MTRESLKTKIAALLAKAENTDNEFEAATFMAKVNELLEKHQIEMHEVRAAGGDSDPIGKEMGETNIYASISWAINVAGALAQYYGCRVIYFRKGNHRPYEVIGRESARRTFELMLPFVISQVKQQAKRLCVGSNNAKSRSVMEREIGQALWIRINNLVPAAEEMRSELTGKGLIPVSDVDAAIREFYPELKAGRAKTVRFSSEARDAANRVGITPQTTNKEAKLLK